MNFRSILLSVAAVVFAVVSTVHASPFYTIKDITPAGYNNATAYDINSSGDVVGVAESFATGSSVREFFFYDHSAGTSTIIGASLVSPRRSIIGTGFREAAINDSGVIAGTAMFTGGAAEARGFIYSSGSFSNLGTLYLGPGTGSNIRPASDALDINSSGVATGTASSGAATSDNIDIYTGSSAPVSDIDGDLTALTKGDLGRAINNAGLIAGSNQDGKATLFSGTAETVFLSGTSLASDSSWATDLNEVGQVTGGTIPNASYIYDTTDSSLRILPNVGTGGRVQAKAINESGDVVGWADTGASLDSMALGFVHVYDDNMSYNLIDQVVNTDTSLGFGDWEKVRTAWGINDDGWIVGVGDRRPVGTTFPFPNARAYLLIPTVIPEPTSLCMLGLCGMGWAFFGRWSSRQL